MIKTEDLNKEIYMNEKNLLKIALIFAAFVCPLSAEDPSNNGNDNLNEPPSQESTNTDDKNSSSWSDDDRKEISDLIIQGLADPYR